MDAARRLKMTFEERPLDLDTKMKVTDNHGKGS